MIFNVIDFLAKVPHFFPWGVLVFLAILLLGGSNLFLKRKFIAGGFLFVTLFVLIGAIALFVARFSEGK